MTVGEKDNAHFLCVKKKLNSNRQRVCSVRV